MVNGHLLGATRLCVALNCPGDAETPDGYCRHCDRKRLSGKHLELHRVEQPSNEPLLRCSKCEQWKPDDEFARNPQRVKRRGRHAECKQCCRTRRQSERHGSDADHYRQLTREAKARHRASMTPEQYDAYRKRRAELARIRYARKKAAQ